MTISEAIGHLILYLKCYWYKIINKNSQIIINKTNKFKYNSLSLTKRESFFFFKIPMICYLLKLYTWCFSLYFRWLGIMGIHMWYHIPKERYFPLNSEWCNKWVWQWVFQADIGTINKSFVYNILQYLNNISTVEKIQIKYEWTFWYKIRI